MAKATPRTNTDVEDLSDDDAALLEQLQQEQETKLPFVTTGTLTMRDLVIYSALQVAMKNVANTYIPKGRLANRHEMLERAAQDAIMFADIFGRAYDKFEAEKNA